LDKYPGGGSYSDIFSFWMEALYRIHGKEKSVDLIKKMELPITLCFIEQAVII
jgi:hypothetical protein